MKDFSNAEDAEVFAEDAEALPPRPLRDPQ